MTLTVTSPGDEDPAALPAYPHLDPRTQAIMSGTDAQRIAFAEKKVFFPYPTVVKLLGDFERLLQLPRTSRPRGLLVLQNTNAGKTSLVEQFMRLHPADPNPGGEVVLRPVIRLAMPPAPTEVKLHNAALMALGLSAYASERLPSKLDQITELFRAMGVKVIIIDEAQHLGGASTRTTGLLQTLKHWSTETMAHLIVVGLIESFPIFASSDELINRLNVVAFPRLDDADDFLAVLKAYGRFLPLRQPSNLMSPELARPLMVHSERLLGELDTLLKLLTVRAIEQGSEQITPALIQQVVKNRQWVAPSLRHEVPSEFQVQEGDL